MKWITDAKKFLNSFFGEAKDQAVQPVHITRKENTSLLDSLEEPYEEIMYKNIRKEIEADPHIHWGKNIHTLIISDRCGGRAIGLYEYLKAHTDLTVHLRDNTRSIHKAIQSRAPDIVIFVGYQESKENYDILTAQRGQRPCLTVMYASVDDIIRSECARYGIPLMYHCLDPLADFVRVLRDNLSVS